MNKNKVGALIFIRSDSRRLPQKTFLPLGKKKLFLWTIEAGLKLNIDELIVATSDEPTDDLLSSEIKNLGFKVFRGSKKNIAFRALDCSKVYGLDYFIRINGDSPFINIPLINQGIDLINKRPDYITNLIPRTYPYGISCEIIKVEKFGDLYPNFNEYERTHITSYYLQNLNQIKFESCKISNEDFSSTRLTIDTPEDYAILQYYLSRSKLSDFNDLEIKLLLKDFKEIVNDKFIFHKA